MAKNEIIKVLRVNNSGELPYLQEKVDYLRNHVSRLEHEQKKKEYNLSVLDKRINDLAYREYSNYQKSNDYSPKPLPYKEDGIYSNSDMYDKSIRPISFTTRQSRRISLNYDQVYS